MAWFDKKSDSYREATTRCAKKNQENGTFLAKKIKNKKNTAKRSLFQSGHFVLGVPSESCHNQENKSKHTLNRQKNTVKSCEITTCVSNGLATLGMELPIIFSIYLKKFEIADS